MKARFESRAIAEVAGDAAATDTLWLVIPDPLTPSTGRLLKEDS